MTDMATADTSERRVYSVEGVATGYGGIDITWPSGQRTTWGPVPPGHPFNDDPPGTPVRVTVEVIEEADDE